MPIEANQQPVKGQKEYISTYRLQSNIPKGGTDTTWLYPSPQMFYNGKLGLLQGFCSANILVNAHTHTHAQKIVHSKKMTSVASSSKYTVEQLHLWFIVCITKLCESLRRELKVKMALFCSITQEKQGR